MASSTPTAASTTSPATINKQTSKQATPQDVLEFSRMDEVVTLLVGKEPDVKKYLIHKSFACHYSPIFKAAFNSSFTEGQTLAYHLEDASDGSVQLLVQWLYSEKLHMYRLPKTTTDSQKLDYLVKLWALSYKLLISRLQNVAMREIIAETARQNIIPNSTLACVYEQTAQRSPLRRPFVRYCGAGGDGMSKVFISHPNAFPKEMLLELAAYLTKAIDQGLDKNKLREKVESKDYEVAEC